MIVGPSMLLMGLSQFLAKFGSRIQGKIVFEFYLATRTANEETITFVLNYDLRPATIYVFTTPDLSTCRLLESFFLSGITQDDFDPIL